MPTLVGASTGCFYGLDVVTEDAVDRIRLAGADGVEIFVQGPPEIRPEVVDAIIAHTMASGLAVVSVHPYVYGWENLLFASYERQRRWAFQHVADHIRLCVATGARAYVSHGPPAHHVVDDEGRLSPHYVAVTRDLVALAAQHGVRYCLENVSYGLLTSPDDARRHLDAVPGLGFVIDTKSAWKSGHAPADFLTPDLLPAVHHTQVSFRFAGRYGLPAYDEDAALVDTELAAALAVQIPHILEIEATTAEHVTRSLAAIRRVCGSVPT